MSQLIRCSSGAPSQQSDAICNAAQMSHRHRDPILTQLKHVSIVSITGTASSEHQGQNSYSVLLSLAHHKHVILQLSSEQYIHSLLLLCPPPGEDLSPSLKLSKLCYRISSYPSYVHQTHPSLPSTQEKVFAAEAVISKQEAHPISNAPIPETPMRHACSSRHQKKCKVSP